MNNGGDKVGEKKYYWLKLKRDFFKRHDIRIIEEMPNGKEYLLFYLKLLVESIDHEGNLRFSDTIPYNEQMLSVVTNTNIDIVRSAVKMFYDLKMLDIKADKTIYMEEVKAMIGSETRWAEKKRVQRQKDNVPLLSSQCPTEIEIEKEIDIDYEKILTLYSSICISFPRIKTLTQKRKDAIKERITENKYTYEDFETLFTMAEQSSFLKGHNKDKWSATFDWLIKEDNMAKALEGNYVDKPAPEPEEFKTNNPFLQMLREEGEI